MSELTDEIDALLLRRGCARMRLRALAIGGRVKDFLRFPISPMLRSASYVATILRVVWEPLVTDETIAHQKGEDPMTLLTAYHSRLQK